MTTCRFVHAGALLDIFRQWIGIFRLLHVDELDARPSFGRASPDRGDVDRQARIVGGAAGSSANRLSTATGGCGGRRGSGSRRHRAPGSQSCVLPFSIGFGLGIAVAMGEIEHAEGDARRRTVRMDIDEPCAEIGGFAVAA